jgi:capsular polysaccharide biosynthesis protein
VTWDKGKEVVATQRASRINLSESLIARQQEALMEEAKMLVMAIGSVLITIALTGVIGLLVARHLDNKRTQSRRASLADADKDNVS